MGRGNIKHLSKNSVLRQLIQGFTLIEITIVVAIFGVLIVLTAISLNPIGQLSKARDSQRKSDLKKIANALEDYLGDHPCYPDEATMNCVPGTGLDPYLKKIPCDPVSGQSYSYTRPECNQFIVYAKLDLEKKLIYGTYNYAVASPNYRVVPTIFITTAPTTFIPLPTPTTVPLPTPTFVPLPTPTFVPLPTPTTDQRVLVGGVHTIAECVPAGGTLYNISENNYLCKFTAAVCPGNWAQYLNYGTSTTYSDGADFYGHWDSCWNGGGTFANTGRQTCYRKYTEGGGSVDICHYVNGYWIQYAYNEEGQSMCYFYSSSTRTGTYTEIGCY